MSVWSRIRGAFGGGKAAPVEAEKVEEAPREEPEGERVAKEAYAAIVARRWNEARRILSSARDGANEGVVVEAILAAMGPARVDGANDAIDADEESLLLLLSETLAARGLRRRASELLARARSTTALVLRADLLAEGLEGAPTRKDLETAVALLGRALSIDIDAPGARDRWERLRAQLGHAEEVRGPSIGATLVAKGTSLPYVLLREVARGGAGVVYEAREELTPSLRRTVALKMTHGGPRQSRRALAHEARTAVRFRGPGVIPIFDLDVDAGWLAMAWAAGGSLRARLRDADARIVGAPLRWIAPLVATIADVHAAGWVHGDVKPANVLFDAADAPLLGDFGLARTIGEEQTAGSAGYVSPERAAGAPCSPADDVYGLGKLLADVAAAGARGLDAAIAACTAPIADRPADARAVLQRYVNTTS